MRNPQRQSSTAPFPWPRIVIVTTVFAVVVGTLWQVISVFDDTGVDRSSTDMPASPAATDIVTTIDATPTEPDSTPEIVPRWRAGSLPALLDLAPDRLADGSLPLDDIATYADIAGWMAAQGVGADPASPSWLAGLQVLALPEFLRANGLDPAWQATYGFTLADIDQVLAVGQAPDYVLIMRGEFDPATLQAAWVASGYQPVEVEGYTAWSLTPGDTIDLSPPASRPAMGTLNNVILLDDGTLVAAARTSRLGTTLRTIDGRDASLAENDAFVALMTPAAGIEALASAVIMRGSALHAGPVSHPDIIAPPAVATPGIGTPMAGEAMPQADTVIVGIPLPSGATPATPTGNQATNVVMMMAVDDLDDALAGRNRIEARYPGLVSPVTGAPYTDRFGELTIRVVGPDPDDGPAAIVIGARLTDGLADWQATITDRDFGFAAWDPPEEP